MSRVLNVALVMPWPVTPTGPGIATAPDAAIMKTGLGTLILLTTPFQLFLVGGNWK